MAALANIEVLLHSMIYIVDHYPAYFVKRFDSQPYSSLKKNRMIYARI